MKADLYSRLFDFIQSNAWQTPNRDSTNLQLIKHFQTAGLQAFDEPDNAVAFLASTPKLRKLLRLQNFWIRSLSTWQPNRVTASQLMPSLFHHLLLQYPVPDCLLHFDDDKYICWLIILGQGGSLRKAAKLFDWHIPKKMTWMLWNVPDDFATWEVTQWIEVQRLGGTLLEFARIQHMMRDLDFTANDADREMDKQFWRNTVRWLLYNRDDILDDHWESMRDWAVHMHSEAQRRGDVFSWSGRSVQSVFRSVQEYENELEVYRRFRERENGQQRVKKKICWSHHGWNWRYELSPTEVVSINELTDRDELSREGDQMVHCVVCYTAQCNSGEVAIFSMRINDQRCLTIEINPHKKEIIQMRGVRNRSATLREKQIVEIWHREVVISPVLEKADD